MTQIETSSLVRKENHNLTVKGKNKFVKPNNSGESSQTEQKSSTNDRIRVTKKKANRLNKNMKLKEKMNYNAPANEYIMNEIVLAKIPGYSPWPARITAIIGETIHIQFFGTGHV